jgi:hypothetical protein
MIGPSKPEPNRPPTDEDFLDDEVGQTMDGE